MRTIRLAAVFATLAAIYAPSAIGQLNGSQTDRVLFDHLRTDNETKNVTMIVWLSPAFGLR